jgi:hypothetical protein
MGDVTSVMKFIEINSVGGKRIIAHTNGAETVDDGDTFTVTLANYGMTKILGISGWIHTTSGSVVVSEAPTTSVTSGVLTVTVGGSTDNKERVYEIIGI